VAPDEQQTPATIHTTAPEALLNRKSYLLEHPLGVEIGAAFITRQPVSSLLARARSVRIELALHKEDEEQHSSSIQ